MRIISKARQMGKTEEAVKTALKTGAYLVVMNKDEARRVALQYPGLRYPITFDELLSGGAKGSLVKNCVIDNADYLINLVAQKAGMLVVEAVTLGKSEE